MKRIQFEFELQEEVTNLNKKSTVNSSTHDNTEHDIESISKKKEIEQQHLAEINALKQEVEVLKALKSEVELENTHLKESN